MYDDRERILDAYLKRRRMLEEKNRRLFVQLEADLQIAEIKHPVFAVSRGEALLRVAEELGECAQAHNKGQGTEHARQEARDLLCVVWRLVREDWKDDGNE